LLKTNRDVGIVGYGCYVPRFRIKTSEMARVWGKDVESVPIKEKSVPGNDEDAVTIGIEAARNALQMAGLDARKLRAVWAGSESKPYAVKPSSTIIAEAIGATPEIEAADWEFACKAGTEAMQACFGFVGSGMAEYAMALGIDTAQGRPADHLEYTAAAGGASYIIGPAEDSLAILEASYSYVTDTPDFFRRQHMHYPEHGNRFTGAPAYFNHTLNAANALMKQLGKTPNDYDLAVFHQPNTKFPLEAAKILGFSTEKVVPGLVIPYIGNTYSGSCLIGLAATLDVASPGSRILCVSYGSGAGSDAFSFVVTDKIGRRDMVPNVKDYVEQRCEIDYATYSRFRRKFRM
jgi:hydroxymethylglutaryl-CoA synthase